MSDRPRSLSGILGLANSLVILFMAGTLVAYWFWLARPLIQADERTKTELLATSYTKLVTDAVESQDPDHIDATLGELLLLTESETGKPMILRVELELADGRVLTRGPDIPTTGLSTFAVDAPLFSPTSFELLGTLRLYKALIPDRERTVFWGTAVVILLLPVGLQALLWRLLRPLESLSTNLKTLDPTHLRSLPSLRGYPSQEIQQVSDAVDDLLARLDDARALTEQQRELAERQAEELARSNSELEQFAYVASHDLKAPLRAIDNLSKWLEEDLGEALQGESREHMALLRSRVQRLELLLDDLLAYSRAGRVHVEVRRVDTRVLVEEVVGLSGPPAGFTITVGTGMPVLETAPGPLAQVFRNLIGNAIKHHDRAEGHIEVRASEGDGHWEFSVTDDGPGIPAEFHGKIFQMFQTLKPRDVVEGSGMGLAIVKKLVEFQGGTIQVESEPARRGTTFRFTWRKEWQGRQI